MNLYGRKNEPNLLKNSCKTPIKLPKFSPRSATTPSIWWNSAKCVASKFSLRKTRSMLKYFTGLKGFCKKTESLFKESVQEIKRCRIRSAPIYITFEHWRPSYEFVKDFSLLHQTSIRIDTLKKKVSRFVQSWTKFLTDFQSNSPFTRLIQSRRRNERF